MVKRVSLKGKGADIFFGEEVPTSPLPSSSEAEASLPPPQVANVAPTHDDAIPTSRLASKQASTQASKPAHKQARRAKTFEAPSNVASLLPAIYDRVAARATITNTFRYTDEELTALADALYQVNRQHRVKLTKQDVARLGLNAVLWDYDTNGEESLLMQLALRRKRDPGGDS